MEQQEKDIKAVEQVIKLMAKTGLFFGCVDGSYDVSERQFIENFTAQLSAVGPIDEVQDMLAHATDVHYTLDEIVAETRQLLNGFDNVAERQMVAMALYQFIDNVVKADGVEHPAEREAFIAWNKALVDDLRDDNCN
ncbi:MAG: hypothetical protein IJ632_01075 [Muribaculaceae bacterium]|nr:hypothetical protein [Muribaculaceae bacterium]